MTCAFPLQEKLYESEFRTTRECSSFCTSKFISLYWLLIFTCFNTYTKILPKFTMTQKVYCYVGVLWTPIPFGIRNGIIWTPAIDHIFYIIDLIKVSMLWIGHIHLYTWVHWEIIKIRAIQEEIWKPPSSIFENPK